MPSPLSLKDNVSLTGLQPPIAVGLLIAAGVYAQRGVPLMVTSATDGKHAVADTLHPKGLALDLRLPSRYVASPPSIDAEIAQALRDALGPTFDVVLEHDHIHMEYDPKVKQIVAPELA